MTGLSGHLESGPAALLNAPDSDLDEFLREADAERAFKCWFGDRWSEDDPPTAAQVRSWLTADVARIDRLLNRQLNAILHHPRFQRLEASWRGLAYLVAHKPDEGHIHIRVLDVSWKELSQDGQRAIEFDQSEMFQKVYEQEFGMPGGQPFGLLLGDYEIRHRLSREHPVDDIGTLTSLAQVAAAAFAPLVVSASPEMFGMERFQQIDRRLNPRNLLAQAEYARWHKFRGSEDSRFVGVTFPRVLARRPYQACSARNDQFPFKEDVSGLVSDKYLWGNAAFSLGAIAMRAFAESAWLEDIVGASRHRAGGGVIPGLPIDSFNTDREGTATKVQTDALLTDESDRNASSYGYIPLCHCKYTDHSAFYSMPSVHQPEVYTNRAGTRSAELSTQLNLMLCVSRFAHFIKVMLRNRTGSFASPEEIERYVQNWIRQYVSADPNVSSELRASYPLREASIQVRGIQGRPGAFVCVAHLRPHVQGESAAAAIRLVTELSSWAGRPLSALTGLA